MSNQSDLAKSAAGFNGDPLSIDTANNRIGVGASSVPAAARAMVSGGRFYVNSQDQYSVLLQNGGTSGGFIGTTGVDTINFFRSNGTEHMKIDSAGRVTMPYQPGFAAYSPATSTGSGAIIIYGSTYHNIGNHYNTSTGTFTAPVAGRYLFTASCLFNYSSGAYHRLNFRLNGSVYNTYGETLENQAGPSYSTATTSNIFSLNANDTMEMHNGSSVTTYGSSYGHFSGIMLA